MQTLNPKVQGSTPCASTNMLHQPKKSRGHRPPRPNLIIVRPQTRYARSGDISIAYQVVGGGPFDLVLSHGWVSHLDMQWEEPHLAAFLGRLASFARLITFDKRGTGLSDRVALN